MAIACFAAFRAKDRLREFSYEEPQQLGAFDVLIEISHCGICHSDIHLIDNDWRISTYPLVPGHEIVGTIARIGQAVVDRKIGQRVGVGWQAGSCMRCEWCLRGEEHLCDDNAAVAVGHYGGFADKVVVDSRFTFPLPDRLDSVKAAPLLCGGVTVYSPIRRLMKATDKVGVIGIGGLGHLALQCARAFGCEVTAFSHDPDKEKAAKRFGADYFVSSTDKKKLATLRRRFDFLLTTVNIKLDWQVYLEMLRPNGRLIVIGAVNEPLEIPAGAIISGQKGVIASVIGSRHLIQEMLEFASHHHIAPETEVVALRDVNRAIAKIRKGQARYRMVLEV